MSARAPLLFTWSIVAWANTAPAADYAIRDGDTVVFLGDSITAARTYGKVIEHYTLMRFPRRRVQFINAGWGGDTAAGGLKRLDRDVFSRGATLLTVAYGINDIGWGTKADEQHRRLYLDSVRGIVEACKSRGVRVFICSAAITAGDQGEDDYLQKMCNEGMAISSSLGEGAIDVMGTMRQIQKRVKDWNAAHPEAKDTLHAPDGIHLSDLGQLAFGFAIIKGLGGPAEVSSVTISGRDARLMAASGCTITGLINNNGTLAFTRLDEGLPMFIEPLWQLQFRFIPFPNELARYMLCVKDLAPGRYDVLAGGRLVGTWDAGQLSDGVNLASASPDPWQPGGPWDAQSHLVKQLTEARNQTGVAMRLAPDLLTQHPESAKLAAGLAELDEVIQQNQRNVARPAPYRFLIRPADAPGSRPSPP